MRAVGSATIDPLALVAALRSHSPIVCKSPCQHIEVEQHRITSTIRSQSRGHRHRNDLSTKATRKIAPRLPSEPHRRRVQACNGRTMRAAIVRRASGARAARERCASGARAARERCASGARAATFTRTPPLTHALEPVDPASNIARACARARGPHALASSDSPARLTRSVFARDDHAVSWLLRGDGHRYRANSEARLFKILFQPREGALWSTVTGPSGAPVTIPIRASAATFLAAVGGILGSYQLVPCDLTGRPRGTAPERIDLDKAATLARFRAPPPPVQLRRREPQRKPRRGEPVASIERLRRRPGGDGS